MTDTTVSPVVLDKVLYSWAAGKPVIDIPEMQIAPGEKVFIKGPSGSGKTTLLGLIGGVLEPDSGDVKLLGTSLNQLSPVQRDAFRAQHIGFIFQMFNLIPYLSVVENVVLPATFAPRRKQRVIEQGVTLEQEAERLLSQLGLNDPALLKRQVTELSIGQQQRVAAARALIGRPEIIIADEPTSALDADAREAFIRLLFQECEAAGSTLLFVSHDSALEKLFDRGLSLADINRASPQAKAAANSNVEVACLS